MLHLHPHPATPCHTALRIGVQWRRAAGGQGWWLRYVLSGDVAQLRLPTPSAQPAAVDGLWQGTCFEAFATRAGAHAEQSPTESADKHTGTSTGTATHTATHPAAEPTAYREFNFSPSGDWAAYAFARERERAAGDAGPHGLAARLSAAQPPRIRCQAQAHALSLIAHLPNAALGPGPWRLGLSAVITLQDGSLSHWALHHPAPRPDFHAPSGWTAALPGTPKA